MREYGQIQCSFWTDPEILSLGNDAKLLAAYLMTGPHSNGIGCYRLPFGYVEADFGWSSETVSKAFAELSEIGFAMYCERSQFVFMPRFLKFNPISNANVATNREREFRVVPKNSSFYAALAQSLLTFGKHFANPFETLLQTIAEGLDEGFTKQDPTRTEPNREEQEREGAAAPPACPHQEIIELYHETLPALPRVKAWTDERQALLRSRWREDPKRQDLDWWRKFFGYVSQSDFLMGRAKGRGDAPPFMADLEWLIRPKNFVKVIEGKYENREAA